MPFSKLLIKYGGNAMINQELKQDIAQAIRKLQQGGFQITLVHGGGPFIQRSLDKNNIHSTFVQGQRQTSDEAMVEIQKTLIGEVNADLVALFSKNGIRAVGLSGLDDSMVRVDRKYLSQIVPGDTASKIDLGRVGEIRVVSPGLMLQLMDGGLMPVVACVGTDDSCRPFNVNADDFAGEVAAAIEADYYISLTDVDGLYQNYPDPASLLKQVKLDHLPQYYGQIIRGGMIPKVQSCENALRKGVKKAVILNGTKPRQLLDLFQTERFAVGTTIIH